MKSIKPGTWGVIKSVYSFGPYAYGVIFDGMNIEIAMKAEEIWLTQD